MNIQEYQIPLNPPSHATSTELENRLAVASLRAFAFELSLFRNPICKKVLCIAGGMLMFFDAVQPHRTIAGRKALNTESSVLGVGIGTITKKMKASKNEVSSFEMNSLIISSAKGPELSQMSNPLSKLLFDGLFYN
jgi:hypothetical protein